MIVVAELAGYDDPRAALYQVFGKELEKSGLAKKRVNRMSVAIASLLISGGKTTISESPVNSAPNSQASPPAQQSPIIPRQALCATPNIKPTLKTPKTSTPISPCSQQAPHSNLPVITQVTTHLPLQPIPDGHEEDESPIMSSAPAPLSMNATSLPDIDRTISKKLDEQSNCSRHEEQPDSESFQFESTLQHTMKSSQCTASKKRASRTKKGTSKKPSTTTRETKVPLEKERAVVTAARRPSTTKRKSVDDNKKSLSPFSFPGDDQCELPQPKKGGKVARLQSSRSKKKPNVAHSTKRTTKTKKDSTKDLEEFPEPIQNMTSNMQVSPPRDLLPLRDDTKEQQSSDLPKTQEQLAYELPSSAGDCVIDDEEYERQTSSPQEPIQNMTSNMQVSPPRDLLPLRDDTKKQQSSDLPKTQEQLAYELPSSAGVCVIDDEEYERQTSSPPLLSAGIDSLNTRKRPKERKRSLQQACNETANEQQVPCIDPFDDPGRRSAEFNVASQQSDQQPTSASPSLPPPPRSRRARPAVNYDTSTPPTIASPCNTKPPTPCSVRVEKLRFERLPSSEPTAISRLQLTASNILEDFNSSMLDVMAAADPVLEASRNGKCATPKERSEASKGARRGKKKNAKSLDDSPLLLLPSSPAEHVNGPGHNLYALRESMSNPTTPRRRDRELSEESSTSEADNSRNFTVKETEQPKSNKATRDSGVGCSYYHLSPQTPGGKSMVAAKKRSHTPRLSTPSLTFELSPAVRPSKKRDRADMTRMEDAEELRQVKRRKPSTGPSLQASEERRPEMTLKHSACNLLASSEEEAEEDVGADFLGLNLLSDNTSQSSFGQPHIQGNDIQSLVQSFGVGVSDSFKSKQQVMTSFTRSMSNYVVNLVDEFWDDNTRERSQALSTFRQSVSPHLRSLEKEFQAQQNAQEKIIAMMKESIASLQNTRQSQGESLSALKSKLVAYVTNMDKMASRHRERKVSLQRSLLSKSRHEQEKMQQQITKMQVDRIRKSLRATIMNV